MESSASPELTRKHVRAARALLAWSQQDLAKSAGVATSTVADFERGQRTPVANNALAIRKALESAGIRFLASGVAGPAIPQIRASDRAGAPVRWVDSDDLANWAGRNDAVMGLPTLVSNLIRATYGPAVRLRFPSDGGVRHPGWDGRTTAAYTSEYVPEGDAGWEIGSQERKIAQKITEEYTKRTDKPTPLDPHDSAFIFVTPRHWPQKDEWAKARQAEGPWREVRVYDADDLVHWIEQTPAVGLWLATRLGKRPPGVRELEGLWEEWSFATEWRLTEDLVLSDRDEDATEILRWLRDEPAILSLQATTVEEVGAFFHATIALLPKKVGDGYRNRCIVATDVAGARSLINAPGPLILILLEPDPGLARSLVEKGHYVLQAYDERPVTRGDMRRLARPSGEGIAAALIDGGIPEPRARALARDSARNLAILRRLMPAAPGRLPTWAEQPPPRALLAALLAGAWDEDLEADKAKLSELADAPYGALAAALVPYVGELDSPLRKIGPTWRMASPPDAWMLLARHLTTAEVERFESVAYSVLASVDPRFEMDANDRWMAAVKGVRPEYSGLLRHGVGEVMILMALWGKEMSAVSGAGRRAEAIVRKLLNGGDEQRWWSLSRDFRLLAEAAPSAFLDALEDSLGQTECPLRALFSREESGIFGTENLSDLLWALESLAWSPDYVTRVSLILARLDVMDNPPGKHGNRPARSLREIHLLWNPQTFASLDERLRVLDLIRKKEPDAAWKLMLGVLPSSHDTATPAPMPRWRDFTIDSVEPVTWPLIGRGAEALSSRLISDVGMSVRRWELLLGRLGDLAPSTDAALTALEAAEPQFNDPQARDDLWTSLRGILHNHRQFPDAQWRLPDDVLSRLDAIYQRFAPADPLERIAWLFKQSVQLPNPSKGGWEATSRDVDAARQKAATGLFSQQGVNGVLALAGRLDTAGFIGKALVDGGIAYAALDPLLETALRSQDARERDLAHGLIVSMFPERKEAWVGELINTAKAHDWGDTALLTILRAVPSQPWTWAQAADAGPEVEQTYWRRTPVYWVSEDSETIATAIKKLIGVGRARHALGLADRASRSGLESELIVEALREAARQPFEAGDDTNEPAMFQYHVTELLDRLVERSDVDKDTLVGLEWTYLPLLQYSRRPMKALVAAISEQPSLFIEMLSAIFRPSEDSGVDEDEPDDPERARAIANQAYRLLDLCDRLPGTQDNGTIDSAGLEAWIKEARSLAKKVGREEIADSRIGNLLSASPMGADGNWPAEAVRDALDLFRSKAMLNGFTVGKSNRRGVTTRMPRDGGGLERAEAAKYSAWAKAIAFDHPHTAKALDTLAERYEDDAQREDEQVERMDWQV